MLLKQVGLDTVEKAQPNAEVCHSVKQFLSDRSITDPFVVMQVYGPNPPKKGPERDLAIQKLRDS